MCTNRQCPSGSYRLNKNAHTHTEIFIVSLNIHKHLLNYVSWRKCDSESHVVVSSEVGEPAWGRSDFTLLEILSHNPAKPAERMEDSDKQGPWGCCGRCLVSSHRPSRLDFLLPLILVQGCVMVYACMWWERGALPCSCTCLQKQEDESGCPVLPPSFS